MKNIIAILTILFTINLQASDNFIATVDETFCGEMDPFEVGDVCLVQLTKHDGKRLAIVLDYHEYLNTFDEDQLIGKTVKVYSNTLSKIYSTGALDVLRDFDSAYFYMNGEMDSFKVLNHSSKSGTKSR